MTQHFKYDKVLVIDDTALDRLIADRVMKVNSFAKDITCINSASAALSYLEAHCEELPELIFLDLNMPGMDGFQFLKEYKNLPCNIKKKSIVMLTSSVLEQDKRQALSNEYVVSFISKPLSKENLRQLYITHCAA
jgi:CheY-like chemotaxis protein